MSDRAPRGELPLEGPNDVEDPEGRDESFNVFYVRSRRRLGAIPWGGVEGVPTARLVPMGDSEELGPGEFGQRDWAETEDNARYRQHKMELAVDVERALGKLEPGMAALVVAHTQGFSWEEIGRERGWTARKAFRLWLGTRAQLADFLREYNWKKMQ